MSINLEFSNHYEVPEFRLLSQTSISNSGLHVIMLHIKIFCLCRSCIYVFDTSLYIEKDSQEQSVVLLWCVIL